MKTRLLITGILLAALSSCTTVYQLPSSGRVYAQNGGNGRPQYDNGVQVDNGAPADNDDEVTQDNNSATNGEEPLITFNNDYYNDGYVYNPYYYGSGFYAGDPFWGVGLYPSWTWGAGFYPFGWGIGIGYGWGGYYGWGSLYYGWGGLYGWPGYYGWGSGWGWGGHYRRGYYSPYIVGRNTTLNHYGNARFVGSNGRPSLNSVPRGNYGNRSNNYASSIRNNVSVRNISPSSRESRFGGGSSTNVGRSFTPFQRSDRFNPSVSNSERSYTPSQRSYSNPSYQQQRSSQPATRSYTPSMPSTRSYSAPSAPSRSFGGSGGGGGVRGGGRR